MALKPTSKKLREEWRKGMIELGLYPDKKRSDPASDPNALYVNSVRPSDHLETVVKSLQDSISSLREKSESLYHFAVIQMESGLRTSELISLLHSDITVTGTFRIRGKKRSHSRMISPGISREFLLRHREMRRDPFREFDRFYIRREYKKVGINFYFQGDKKRTVTHIFRHLYVSGMLTAGIEVNEASKFIGHKSVSSTEHYGKFTKGNGTTVTRDIRSNNGNNFKSDNSEK
jgi:site-specific recombinase XerD